MSAEADRLVHEHYELGRERDRLDTPLGTVEFERTKEIIERHLPKPPATISPDIGGGPGRYAIGLARRGFAVIHRDLVPLHVVQVAEESRREDLEVQTAVGDARDLDLEDGCVDAVLLLGPLYHLSERTDRIQALREAHRILRPGGVLFAAAISRWAARLHGEVVNRLFTRFERVRDKTHEVEHTGFVPPLHPGSFTGYAHRPDELGKEATEAGFDVMDLVSVEGIAFALADLEERLANEEDRDVVFEAARALERVPELLGLGPHLLVTARVPQSGGASLP